MNGKNDTSQTTVTLAFALTTTALFLAVSLLFLFGTLLGSQTNDLQQKQSTGMDLLAGKSDMQPLKSAWLFVTCWTLCFLLSLSMPQRKGISALTVVLSITSGIFLVFAIWEMSANRAIAPSIYGNAYYTILAFIFVQASIGYVRSIAIGTKNAEPKKTGNHIHINIISECLVESSQKP